MDAEAGDGGWVGPGAPDGHPGAEAGADVDVAGEVDFDLNELLERGAGGFEAKLQVFQGFGGLGAEIAFADDLAVGVDGVLAADDQGAGAGREQDRLGEGRVVSASSGGLICWTGMLCLLVRIAGLLRLCGRLAARSVAGRSARKCQYWLCAAMTRMSGIPSSNISICCG